MPVPLEHAHFAVFGFRIGDVAEAAVSGYYLADEIGAGYRTLLKYVPADQWISWRALPVADLAQLLPEIARRVNLRGLQRHPRGPKKAAPKRVHDKRHSHYSTYRLLKEDEEPHGKGWR